MAGGHVHCEPDHVLLSSTDDIPFEFGDRPSPRPRQTRDERVELALEMVRAETQVLGGLTWCAARARARLEREEADPVLNGGRGEPRVQRRRG